jgi:hypothetical protein
LLLHLWRRLLLLLWPLVCWKSLFLCGGLLRLLLICGTTYRPSSSPRTGRICCSGTMPEDEVGDFDTKQSTELEADAMFITGRCRLLSLLWCLLLLLLQALEPFLLVPLALYLPCSQSQPQ